MAKAFCKLILFLSFIRVFLEFQATESEDPILANPSLANSLLAVNHSSFIDSVLLLAYFPTFFRIIAHHSGFNIPVFKQFYKALGFIRSDVNMKIKDQLVLYQALKRGENVLVYSFMRKPGMKFAKFTEEIVNFSNYSHVKILPIRIDFAEKVLPLGSFILQGFLAKILVKEAAFFENREELSQTMQDFID